MEREEIERIEQELDEVLKLIQPEKKPESGMEPVGEAAALEEEETPLEEPTPLNIQKTRKRVSLENAGQEPPLGKSHSLGAKLETGPEKKRKAGPEWELKEPGQEPAEDQKPGQEPEADWGKAEKPGQEPEADWSKAEKPGQEPEADWSAAEGPEEDWDPESGQASEGDDMYGWGPRNTLRLLKPSDGMAAAFFVPVVVMIIIFAQRGIFPFGEECFLRTDMYHQYAPFFSEFQYKLTHGGSLLYSWDIGMGINFSALYAYYLASPANWLLLFWPKGHIIEFMTILIVLKTALSGVAFTWYLRRHFGTMDFGAGLFGVFYALSGYMAAYSWNIMWLDCIMLFPLILLGLERLVMEKRGLLYCITLGLSILSNYYISIMICIFMVIYAIAQLILNPPKGLGDFVGIGFRFGLYSLLAGGLAAVVLLPEIYALQATASGDFDFPKTISSYFSIFDMIARHIGNVGTEIGLDHWPNIYCGVAVLLFFLLYIGSKRIAAREKIVYCSLLLLFFASFSVNVLNFIWHGFHYPNSLPCRQSFIYIALVLTMCYHAYSKLRETPWKHIVLAFWGAVSFVLLAEKLVDNPEQYHFSIFYVAILFLGLYAGILYLYKKGKWSLDAVLLGALFLVAVESAVNTAVTSVPTTSRTAYVKDNEDVRELVQAIRPDTFYRVDKSDRRTKNDGAWMNFPSASLFSSTAHASLSEFFKKLGCESSTNAYSLTGSTPLADSLFSVRYGVYPDQQAAGSLLKQHSRAGGLWMFENTYTLPVAFMLPKDVEQNWMLDAGSPATVQNDLCAVLDVQDVLLFNDSQTEGRKLTFTAEATGDYYVYVTNKKVKEVSVVIREDSLSFDNVDRGYFLELGRILEGEEVRLESEDEGNPTLQAEVWRFSPEGLEAVYGVLNRNPIVLSSWTDTGLAGTITADEAGTMFTSIPYDKGWSILVDGEPAEAREVFDTFLSVDLSAGTHRISLHFEPEGLRTGAWITAGSAIILAAVTAAGYVQTKYRKQR
ncbi:YfhO family protein [Lacrimispora sp. 210928-DFI.3.58]|uniref:YfhO family protein n=1 Tax=Lacrimispora sp. 210928-DFI.3.58 TaxID=2883214 RepID=UPI001D076C7D|nr:YfhO family protein [Lacrimispora sp. 210928-DFI.3.58]MCB7319293.1 YfhO family protein [Lacrimispora sp. 210928-DFI.3.58]